MKPDRVTAILEAIQTVSSRKSPHTNNGVISRNGALYGAFLTYYITHFYPKKVEDLSEADIDIMYKTISSSNNNKKTFVDSFVDMRNNYLDIIELNVQFLVEKQVKRILISPCSQSEVYKINHIVQQLETFHCQLNNSFQYSNSPNKALLLDICKATGWDSNRADVMKLIRDVTIKFVISQKVEVPIYSMPIFESYRHRKVKIWVNRWKLNVSALEKPAEEVIQSGSNNSSIPPATESENPPSPENPTRMENSRSYAKRHWTLPKAPKADTDPAARETPAKIMCAVALIDLPAIDYSSKDESSNSLKKRHTGKLLALPAKKDQIKPTSNRVGSTILVTQNKVLSNAEKMYLLTERLNLHNIETFPKTPFEFLSSTSKKGRLDAVNADAGLRGVNDSQSPIYLQATGEMFSESDTGSLGNRLNRDNTSSVNQNISPVAKSTPKKDPSTAVNAGPGLGSSDDHPALNVLQAIGELTSKCNSGWVGEVTSRKRKVMAAKENKRTKSRVTLRDSEKQIQL